MRFLTRLALPLAFLVAPAVSHAMSCDDIMNMVSVNVPSSIVISTMQSSGKAFTPADVQCLQSRGAPPDVVAAAQSMGGGAPAPAPAPVAAPVPMAPVPAPVAPMPTAPLGGELVPDNALDPNVGPEPTGGGPDVLEQLIENHRQGKNLTASKGLYDLLAANTFPEHQTKTQYYLAKSLEDMDMLHSAQHFYMEVVRRGPSNPYFRYALPKLIGIAQRTGNDVELLRIVDKIPPEQFPRNAKNHLYYLMGRTLYEDKDLAGSAQYFQQVSAKSELYMRSKYFEGIINTERQKLKSAVMSFREVMKAQPPVILGAAEAQQVEDMKDLALINVARIYFGLERFDNADNYYAMVDRDSTYWPQSLFERAWTNFWRADLNLALGLLLTVESPYFQEEEYIPEVTVLRALTFFNLCEYEEVERILAGFEREYKPQQAEIEAFLTQYKDAPQLRDQAYDAFFTNPHPGSTLEKALFSRVLRNRDLSSLVRHMDMMDTEIESINQQKSVWRDTVGDALKQQIEADRVRYKKKAGTELLKELAVQRNTLADLLVQSEIIKFEVTDAQRKDYEYKATLNDVEVDRKDVIDFAVSREIIYWPFNGEFWRDELGYYRYTENGSCE
jgi:tetratricopeptide (TPR) repeat protein